MITGKIIPHYCPRCKKSNVPIMLVAKGGKKQLLCMDCVRKQYEQEQEETS